MVWMRDNASFFFRADHRRKSALPDDHFTFTPSELAQLMSPELIQAHHNLFFDFTGAAIEHIILRIAAMSSDRGTPKCSIPY